MERLLCKFTQAEQEDLERECEGGITFGTACSGAETPLFTLNALQEAMLRVGRSANFTHLFSCEIHEVKQKWNGIRAYPRQSAEYLPRAGRTRR